MITQVPVRVPVFSPSYTSRYRYYTGIPDSIYDNFSILKI